MNAADQKLPMQQIEGGVGASSVGACKLKHVCHVLSDAREHPRTHEL